MNKALLAAVARVRRHLRENRHARLARRAGTRRNRVGPIPVIAVTGSAGKTTAVSLLAHLLGGRPRVGMTAFSNRVVDMFRGFERFDRGTSAIVMEASEYPVGSLEQVSAVLRPTVAVLTISGLDHFTAFRTAAAAAREMAKLATAIPADGFVMVNADDAVLRQALADMAVPIVTFGTDASAEYRVTEASIGAGHTLTIECCVQGKEIRLETPFVGKHFWVPTIAAAATAHRLGVEWGDIRSRLASFEPVFGRCSLVRVPHGPIFICDTTKAPAWSFGASLQTLESFAAVPRRTLVFGTLSDYAGDSRRNYRRIVCAARSKVDRMIFLRHSASHVGASPEEIATGRVLFFDSVEQIARHVRSTAIAGEAILLKGSVRADHLDRIAHDFTMPVRCWLDRCGMGFNCIDCDLMQTGRPQGWRTVVGLPERGPKRRIAG